MVGDLQYPQGEDSHESKLLPLRELELPQDWHGVDQEQNIGKDVDSRVGEPQGLSVETVSRNGIIPELCHGDTVKPRANEDPYSVDGEKSNQTPAGKSHPGGC